MLVALAIRDLVVIDRLDLRMALHVGLAREYEDFERFRIRAGG